ncbi:Flp pilus assembly protein CpaB [Metallumcola ferriviriculae]|uniref:Flp pilus assembly protein CpaB n=1 Tax=Metallumcola ferriviriculae TaxID=3039180 RepID=A0AAU0UNE2_9FIRM|nr:Flp pilus assembly protein CpaB [Desulfitibacteraceae bacterium MK1]
MKNSKARIIFILTIILAGVLAFLVRNYLVQVEEQAVMAQKKAEVLATMVAASKPIPEGTKVDKSMLKEVDVPKELIHPQAVKTIEEAIGQFTTVSLLADELILTTKLASSATSNELPYRIPEGKRAITISVNPLIGVGGHIKPGHYIDVLGIFKFEPGEEAKPEVLTLLQNIKVLAIGPNIKKLEGVMEAPNITIAVSPEEAEYITLTENIGRMKYTLRPVGEKDVHNLPTATEERLKAKYRVGGNEEN